MTRPLVVLRPEPEAQATAERARAMGLQVLVRPLFAGAACEWALAKDSFDAILFTSANALRFGGPRLSAFAHLPAYAVGAATADAARTHGFAVVHAGERGVAEVLQVIAAVPVTRLLHVTGRDVTPFPAPSFEVVSLVTYVVDPLPPPDLPENGVFLVHSRRAAERLAALTARRKAIDLIAISAKTAEGAGTGWRSIDWPDAPTDAAMLALAAPLCEG